MLQWKLNKNVPVKYSSMPVQSLLSQLCNYELETFSLEAEIVKVIGKLRAKLNKTEGQTWIFGKNFIHIANAHFNIFLTYREVYLFSFFKWYNVVPLNYEVLSDFFTVIGTKS